MENLIGFKIFRVLRNVSSAIAKISEKFMGMPKSSEDIMDAVAHFYF